MPSNRAMAIVRQHGHALPLSLGSSEVVPTQASDADAAGVLLDPCGALVLLQNGNGHALRFAHRAEILHLVLCLLGLHDDLARREATSAHDAAAELDRIVAARASIQGSGNA
ncbi:hypothetical protein [Roseomonas sp. BN140053]|uniref:hypothetical protein n=1 Tax=Roseomonas sp. BN140053 TaxID=3391898 RepID=UPI0039EBF675